jgi:hypothetical protein
MRKIGFKDVFGRYVLDEDLDKCGLWCFGEEYKELDEPLKYMKAWNILHGEKLMLTRNGQISEDVPKMIDLWKEEFYKQ